MSRLRVWVGAITAIAGLLAVGLAAPPAGAAGLTGISGTVRDAAGAPVASHRVTFVSVDTSTGDRGLETITETASDGSFTRELLPGDYQVHFGLVDSSIATEVWRDRNPLLDESAPDSLPGSELVHVEPGEMVVGIDATVDRGGAIAGRVVAAGSATVATARDFASTLVYLEVRDAARAVWVRSGATWGVDPTGRFRIGSLDAHSLIVGSLYPDTYRVVVEYLGPRGRAVATSGALVVRAGAASSYSVTLRPRPTAPVNVRAPFVTSDAAESPARIGTTWTVDPGVWLPTNFLRLAWLRCDHAVTTTFRTLPPGCAIIPGQTQFQYRSVPADAGSYVTAFVTSFNTHGTSRVGAATTIATEPPVAPASPEPPTINGNGTRLGAVWAVDAGSWTGTPLPTVTHVWLRCSSRLESASPGVPATCSPIRGATAPTYTVSAADSGSFLAVQVTAVNLASRVVIVTPSSPRIATWVTLCGASRPRDSLQSAERSPGRPGCVLRIL